MNFFGGPSTIAVKASAKLKQLEEENEDAMFVIISDLWLDSVEVLEKIQTMFSGLMHFSSVFDCTKPFVFSKFVEFVASSNDLLCLLQAIQQCLPPASSSVGTFPLPHMAKIRSSHLKVRSFEAWELCFLTTFIRFIYLFICWMS